jgi:5-methylcytosine-specific restriction endonuclease McrA
MNSTLLLNASYEPLKIISWEKAITLFFLGKVEVIDSYDKNVRSVSLVMRVPSVVRLVNYVKLTTRKPPLTKINLLARDDFSCQYCKKYLSKVEATVDHVVPRTKGGKTIWQNVVLACPPCNRKKGGRTPEEANMPLSKKPEAPNWLPVVNFTFEKNIPIIWNMFLRKL